MQRIKRDDRVMVIAGRDRGKIGTVTRALADGRVYVSGINMVMRYFPEKEQKEKLLGRLWKKH